MGVREEGVDLRERESIEGGWGVNPPGTRIPGLKLV